MIANIPRRSLRNFVIFTGVLVVVVGLLVVPSYFAIGKAQANRSKVENALKEQRQLAPIFKRLVKKSRELNASGAKMPVRDALARDSAGGVADRLTQLAADNRLQVAGITLDLNAMVNEAPMMQVDMTLRGNITDYRAFLDQLIVVPHVGFVERFKITAIPGGREYRMRVWVVLK